MSLLKKKEATVQLKFSIPLELNDRLQKVQEKAEAQGNQVDIDGVMTKALSRAIREAEVALGIQPGKSADQVVPGAPAPTARP